MSFPGKWSEREDEILRRAYREGHDDKSVIRILSSVGIVRTEDGVASRRRKLRLTKNHIAGKRKHPVKKIVLPVLSKDETPLAGPPTKHNVAECIGLLVACMQEARFAGESVNTVGDLRRYIQRFELDIVEGIPRHMTVHETNERSLVGTHWSHCE